MSKKGNLKSNIVDYIGIVLIILSSGSYLYEGHYNLIIIFDLLFILTRLNKISISSLTHKITHSFVLPFLLLVFMSMVIWGVDDNTYISYITFSIFSLVYYGTTDSNIFKKNILNIIGLLCLWANFCYILFLAGYPIETFYSGKSEWDIIFGINIRVSESRLCGLSFEPGVFQIILIYTLLFLSTELRSFKFAKLQWFYLFMIFTSIILTKSTMGYLSLGLVITYWIVTSKVKKHVLKGIASFVILLVAIFLIYNSSVVQDKFTEANGNESLTVRILDANAAYQMIKLHPIIGNGLDTNQWHYLSKLYGNITNSNGVLSIMSRLGVLWLIFFIMYAVKGKKQRDSKGIMLLYLLCIISPLLNEDICYTPIAYMFVVPFLTEKQNQTNIKTLK